MVNGGSVEFALCDTRSRRGGTVYAGDLKSLGPQGSCGFDSRRRHQHFDDDRHVSRRGKRRPSNTANTAPIRQFIRQLHSAARWARCRTSVAVAKHDRGESMPATLKPSTSSRLHQKPTRSPPPTAPNIKRGCGRCLLRWLASTTTRATCWWPTMSTASAFAGWLPCNA